MKNIIKFINKNKTIVLIFVLIIFFVILLKNIEVKKENFDNKTNEEYVKNLLKCDESCKKPIPGSENICVRVNNGDNIEKICFWSRSKESKGKNIGCIGCTPFYVYDENDKLKVVINPEDELYELYMKYITNMNLYENELKKLNEDTKLKEDEKDLVPPIDDMNNKVIPNPNSPDPGLQGQHTNIIVNSSGRNNIPFNIPRIEQETTTIIRRFDPVSIDSKFNIYTNKAKTTGIPSVAYISEPQPYMTSLNI
jgi:hypothetical protein